MNFLIPHEFAYSLAVAFCNVTFTSLDLLWGEEWLRKTAKSKQHEFALPYSLIT